MKKSRLAAVSLFTFGAVLFSGAGFVPSVLASSYPTPSVGAEDHDNDKDDSHITTIVGLKNIVVVGATDNVVDAQGNAVTADPNPYKIVVVPENLSQNLREGDVVVSNIGNTDHGTTLIKFAAPAAANSTGVILNAAAATVLGPSGLAVDVRKLVVANAAGNTVLLLNPDGTLFATVTDPQFNGPWSAAVRLTEEQEDILDFFALISHSGNPHLQTIFTSNKFDAKVLRIDVVPPAQKGALPTFKVTEIAQFAKNAVGPTKVDLFWQPHLKVGNQVLKDVLVAIDPVNNAVVALPQASTLTAPGTPVTIFQGTPLNTPGGIALNPFNGDVLIVNLADNNLVEINPHKGTVVGVQTVDPLIVDAQGNNSALFGVAAAKDKNGNLQVFYTDDNTNTLNVLRAQ